MRGLEARHGGLRRLGCGCRRRPRRVGSGRQFWRATPTVQGGLLDPGTFPSPWAQLTTDEPPLERPDPEITGPLRTSVHDEVLQDVLNAQAGLPPVKPQPETWLINGRIYNAVSAHGFDPARSNGVTAMQTPADDAAAWAGMSKVAVPYGDDERAGYIAHSPSRVVAVRGQAGGGDGYDTYTYNQPVDSPPIHGHIDRRRFSTSPGLLGSSELPSDGFVDNTEARGGLGDAWSLSGPHPQPSRRLPTTRWAGMSSTTAS